MRTNRTSNSTSTKTASRAMRFLRKHSAFLWGVLGVGLLLAVWEIVAVSVDLDIVVPRVGEVAVAFGQLWTTRAFYVDTGYTLLRCAIGFSIAFAVGLVLGVLGGIFAPVRQIVRPLVALFRAAPTMALTLLFMIWFYTNWTPVAIGFLMVFPVIYSTVSDSIATAPADLIQMAKVYNMPLGGQIRYIYMPHATPMVLSAVTTAFGLNIKATVSAEVLSYTAHSIGLNMYNAKSDILSGAARLFAWLLVAVCLSVAVELLLKGLQRLLSGRYTNAH